MVKRDKIQKMIKPMLCSLCLILTGCSAASIARESSFESAYGNNAMNEVQEEEEVDIYVSAATVVIKSVDEAAQKVSMYLIDRNKTETFSYNGITTIQDKYGSAMTAGQLVMGDIAEITYNSELERLGSVTLSEDAWSYESVEKYNLNAGNSSATIGNETYHIDDHVLAFSDGKVIDASQIIHQDVLTLRGKGNSILSITIDKGHGYLNLENDEAVLGSWIEVGQTVISQIAPNMLLTVPEGSYAVRIKGEGIDETREVVIERNKEAVLNLEDVKVQKTFQGTLMFDISPSTATVYVDDIKVDARYAAKVPLGLHLVEAKASGYESLAQYFEVKAGTNSIVMELEEESTISENTLNANVDDKADSTVTIKTPEGAEIYQDNLYMGIAPVTYAKTAGEHTITLRKSGYITRSYAITVPDDNEDVIYSFPDLDPVIGQNTVSENSTNNTESNKKTVSGNGIDKTVSGNSVSDNSIADRR